MIVIKYTIILSKKKKKKVRRDLKKIPVFPRYVDSGFSGDFKFYLIIDGEKQPCPIEKISPDGDLIVINGQGYEYNSEYWEKLKSKLKPGNKSRRII